MTIRERLVIAKAKWIDLKREACMHLCDKHTTRFKALNEESIYYLKQNDFKRYNMTHKKFMKHVKLAMAYDRQVIRECLRLSKLLEQCFDSLPESEKSKFIETIDELKKTREELEAMS